MANLERTRGILRKEKHLWGQRDRGKPKNSPVQNGGLGMVCQRAETSLEELLQQKEIRLERLLLVEVWHARLRSLDQQRACRGARGCF